MKGQEQNFITKFSGFLVYRRWLALLIGCLCLFVLSAGMMSLKSDFSYRIWFKEDNNYLKRFDEFERLFGNDENIAVVIHSPDGIFDEDSIRFVKNLTQSLWTVKDIIRVDSLSNYNWTDVDQDSIIVEPLFPIEETVTSKDIAGKRKKIMAHEVLPGYLISKDQKTTIIYGQLQPAIQGGPDFKGVVESAREVLASYQDDPNHTLYMTGTAAINYGFEELGTQDMEKVMPVVMSLIIVLLLVSFRRMSGMILPFMVIIASIVMTMGAAGFLGLQFNNLTSAVPPILIAISIADSVHILFSFFRYRRADYERKEAAFLSAQHNFLPTLLTSVSTMIGFFSYATADVVPIVQMGIMAGLGTLFAWLATMLLLVPTLAWLPLRIKQKTDMTTAEQPSALAIAYVSWIQRHATMVIVVSVVAVAYAVFIATKNEVNSDPLKYFAENVPVRVANDFAEDHISGMQALEIMVESGREEGVKNPAFLHKVDEFQNWLLEQPYIDKTISLLDIFKDTNRALNGGKQEAYAIPETEAWAAQELFLYTMSMPEGMDINNRVTIDNRSLRLTALSSLHDSKESLYEINRIEEKAQELGLNARVTGKMPLSHSINPLIVHSFFYSIVAAFVVIAALISLVFRSVWIGLLAMVPNIVPLFFGAAIMALLNRPLDVGTVLVASTCLGIAIDDTIHFLSNYYKRLQAGYDKSMAIAQVFAHTGPALLITTVVLVISFGSFVMGSFIPNVNFGVLTAVVLSVALLVDFTLLPALLLLGSKAAVPQGGLVADSVKNKQDNTELSAN